MRKKHVRVISYAAIWAPRFSGFALFVLIIAAILHYFSFIRTKDFLLIFTFSILCALISLVFAAIGLHDLWKRGDKGGLKALRAIVYAFITLAPLIIFIGLWFKLPALRDVSTDTQNPPLFLQGARPNDALPLSYNLKGQEAAQKAAWPHLSGRRYDGPPELIVKSVTSVLAKKDWKLTMPTQILAGTHTILVETEAKTQYIGFVSDIIIRLSDEGETTYVDMRAASRYLPYDFGENAEFILQFMDALDKEIYSVPINQEAK